MNISPARTLPMIGITRLIRKGFRLNLSFVLKSASFRIKYTLFAVIL